MKWERVELGEVCELIKTGKTPPSKKREYYDGDINWFTPGDFTEIKYLSKSNRTLTGIAVQEKKATLFPKDTLLVTCIGEIGKSGIIKKPASSNQQITALKPKEQVSLDFLYYWTQFNKPLLAEYANNAVVPILNNTQLKKIPFKYPPLPEQRRLAGRLDQADALRQKSRALVETYAALGRSVFLEVFGDPVRNERGWEVVELIDHVKIHGGGTPSKKNKSFYTGEIPWVSPKDMKSIFIDSSIDKITDEAIENSSTKLVPEDSVLMVVRSGILKKQLPVGINICPVTLNQDMKAFVCEEKLNPYYLLYLFLVLAPNILKSVRGTTADNISSDVLKKLQIPLPPLPIQSRFAGMVANIEEQRRLSEAQLLAAEEVFSGVLQGTFGGFQG